MSNVPQRPSAAPSRRPSAGTATAPAVDESQLPEFLDDGPDVDLDPAKASEGGIVDETVTITSAKFAKFSFPGRDDVPAQWRLNLEVVRDGETETKRVAYKFGMFSEFVSTKDGNKMKPRVTPGKAARVPYKFAPAMLFLKSLTDAKFPVATLNNDGAKALVGLRVHLRKQRVQGMDERAKDILLVDFIEGTSATPKASTGTQAAPAAQSASSGSDINALSIEAVTDAINSREDKTLPIKDLAIAVVKIAKWQKHPERGAILKFIKDGGAAFLNHDGAPWAVDGDNLIIV